MIWVWSLTKRHLSNKLCFYQNKIGLIAHTLGGCDTVRCLHASGVAYECRTNWHAGLFSVDDLFAPADTLVDAGVAHWALTAEQVERLPSSLQRLLSLKAVTQPRLANSPIDFACF
ncbi:MAG: hypothetical protein KDE65_13015 [Burkholderiaceae bacterium]|nr:hypothetical protein [Burkholderiaceae bacterium]MCB1987727.1 hypothetical protein [Burkholderiaceae bacterium]